MESVGTYQCTDGGAVEQSGGVVVHVVDVSAAQLLASRRRAHRRLYAVVVDAGAVRAAPRTAAHRRNVDLAVPFSHGRGVDGDRGSAGGRPRGLGAFDCQPGLVADVHGALGHGRRRFGRLGQVLAHPVLDVVLDDVEQVLTVIDQLACATPRA